MNQFKKKRYVYSEASKPANYQFFSQSKMRRSTNEEATCNTYECAEKKMQQNLDFVPTSCFVSKAKLRDKVSEPACLHHLSCF